MKARPPFEKFYVFLFTALLGFIIADLTIQFFRDSMIPSKAPPNRPPRQMLRSSNDIASYDTIRSRNIFNSDNKIPPAKGETGGEQKDEAPIPSQLPIVLQGTIVHANPAKSVVTVNVRGKPENIPAHVGEDIDHIAVITKIERSKVIFRNTATHRLEFVEIKQESKIDFKTNGPKQVGEVMQESEHDFSLARGDVDKLTSDLPKILQDARMLPNTLPDGRTDGFKFMDIAPGSIYEKLGFKRGDVIKAVNGEPVDSPAKAMELYNTLRSQGNIGIGLERNGRVEQFNYNIK